MSLIDHTTATPRERMVRARRFIGLDQNEMAYLLGKSRNTISAWERGVQEPPLSALARWARITGRSIDWIVWGTANAPSKDGAFADGCAPWDLNPEPTDSEVAALFWEIVSALDDGQIAQQQQPVR